MGSTASPSNYAGAGGGGTGGKIRVYDIVYQDPRKGPTVLKGVNRYLNPNGYEISTGAPTAGGAAAAGAGGYGTGGYGAAGGGSTGSPAGAYGAGGYGAGRSAAAGGYGAGGYGSNVGGYGGYGAGGYANGSTGGGGYASRGSAMSGGFGTTGGNVPAAANAAIPANARIGGAAGGYGAAARTPQYGETFQSMGGEFAGGGPVAGQPAEGAPAATDGAPQFSPEDEAYFKTFRDAAQAELARRQQQGQQAPITDNPLAWDRAQPTAAKAATDPYGVSGGGPSGFGGFGFDGPNAFDAPPEQFHRGAPQAAPPAAHTPRGEVNPFTKPGASVGAPGPKVEGSISGSVGQFDVSKDSLGVNVGPVAGSLSQDDKKAAADIAFGQATQEIPGVGSVSGGLSVRAGVQMNKNQDDPRYMKGTYTSVQGTAGVDLGGSVKIGNDVAGAGASANVKIIQVESGKIPLHNPVYDPGGRLEKADKIE
jgi:hypothetical protein